MTTTDISGRLARLERVFDAIAGAWAGTYATTPSKPAGVDTSTPFIQKLTTFASTLDPSEMDQLAVLLAAAAVAGKQAAKSPQNDQQRNAASFLLALDVKLAAGANTANTPSGTEASPALTITTITTTIASHPIIGCEAAIQ